MVLLHATFASLLLSAALVDAGPVRQRGQAGIIPFSRRLNRGFNPEQMRRDQDRLKARFTAAQSNHGKRALKNSATAIEALPMYDIHERRKARRQASAVQGLNNANDEGECLDLDASIPG